MSTMRNLLALAWVVSAGCYQDSAYGQGAPTVGTQPSWQGPPGGQMDPQYGAQPQPYQVPQDPNAGQGYGDPYAQQQPVDPNDPNAAQQPAADDPNYGEGAIDDGQIDSTLDAYGTWQDNEDYGRVWVPNATEVGVDFTPYETGGSWVYSDSGWMFDCADYSWGWLPFHYGRWGWFDGYWGWVPGYSWGPAWVDWRYGGGYVGWRPMAPEWRNGEHWNVRDHRHGSQVMDSQWRFSAEGDMGHGRVTGHLYKNPAEGLRVTQPMRPPRPQGVTPVHSGSIMRARMPATVAHGAGVGPRGPFNAQHPNVASQPVYRAPQSYRQPASEQPTWRAPQAYRQPAYQPTYRAPQTYRQPAYQQRYRQPAYQQPYRAPQTYYRPPQQTYRPPEQTYRAPSTPQYHPAPSYHPTYSTPSHSYSAPSYSAPSHSYSAPSHSSGGGGGFHSSGGGGGRHR